MISADQSGSTFPIDIAGLRRFLRNAQQKVGLTGEVNVLITSDEEMCRLNREFRGKNKPTDVLSFPGSADGEVKVAGDIAISAAIAQANAEALGHPFEAELKILLLHGLLHLLGHDHEADRGEMASIEQQLRARLKLPAGLIERSSNRRLRGREVASDKSAKHPAGSGRIRVKARRNS